MLFLKRFLFGLLKIIPDLFSAVGDTSSPGLIFFTILGNITVVGILIYLFVQDNDGVDDNVIYSKNMLGCTKAKCNLKLLPRAIMLILVDVIFVAGSMLIFEEFDAPSILTVVSIIKYAVSAGLGIFKYARMNETSGNFVFCKNCRRLFNQQSQTVSRSNKQDVVYRSHNEEIGKIKSGDTTLAKVYVKQKDPYVQSSTTTKTNRKCPYCKTNHFKSKTSVNTVDYNTHVNNLQTLIDAFEKTSKKD